MKEIRKYLVKPPIFHKLLRVKVSIIISSKYTADSSLLLRVIVSIININFQIYCRQQFVYWRQFKYKFVMNSSLLTSPIIHHYKTGDKETFCPSLKVMPPSFMIDYDDFSSSRNYCLRKLRFLYVSSFY